MAGLTSTTTSPTPDLPYHIDEYLITASDGIRIALKHYSPTKSIPSDAHHLISTTATPDANKSPQANNHSLPSTSHSTISISNTNPIVLTVHGWLDNAASFDNLAPVLASHGYQVISIDLPGHGRSDHLSPDAIYSVLIYPFYVLEVIRILNIPPCLAIGHSLGAVIWNVVAATFPEKILKVVSIEMLGIVSRPDETATASWRNYLLWKASDKALHRPPSKVYQSFEQAAHARVNAVSSYPGNQYLSQEAALILVKRAMDQLDKTIFRFTHDPRLYGPSPTYLTHGQSMSVLRSIQCPLLYIYNEKSGWPMSTQERQNRINAVRHIKVVQCPGSHHLHLDPDTAPHVAQVCLSFLTSPAKF